MIPVAFGVFRYVYHSSADVVFGEYLAFDMHNKFTPKPNLPGCTLERVVISRTLRRSSIDSKTSGFPFRNPDDLHRRSRGPVCTLSVPKFRLVLVVFLLFPSLFLSDHFPIIAVGIGKLSEAKLRERVPCLPGRWRYYRVTRFAVLVGDLEFISAIREFVLRRGLHTFL